MLLGMQLRDTGIKRYPIRVRPRIIQYAITLVLRQNDQKFLRSLKQQLVHMYPLHQQQKSAADLTRISSESDSSSTVSQSPTRTSIMYIYYPGEFNLLEFMPLCMAFVMLFIYVYFSVRKIDVIRSRAFLALCAVVTVLSSLMMSLGLCFFFGLTISMQSNVVFQYLVILVGLENVLVITKSVVSTDNTFDVKIRVAQGLSREGWTISKTLLTEITILTIGLATFVPVIQEFCIFAIVGLISDFFLQMMLFSTVLAMDIKRIEVIDLRKVPSANADGSNGLRRIPFRNSTITPSLTINRSRSHPKLTALDTQQPIGERVGGVVGPVTSDRKIPKRLRIVNFWARTRFFQRAFMLWMIVWIGSIIYNSRILEQIFDFNQQGTSTPASRTYKSVPDIDHWTVYNHSSGSGLDDDNSATTDKPNTKNAKSKRQHNKQYTSSTNEGPFNITEQIFKLRHPEYDSHYSLSNFHWSTILRQYNISMSGKYVTVLPAIKLSYAVPAEVAVHIRNPNEKTPQHFQWKALAAALDPIDFADLDVIESPPGTTPLYPKSPMEILLTAILCAISVFVLTYTMVVFYRCICTRNYAEWRSSWNDTDVIHPKTQRILEGVPIQVKGHMHRIECMVTDGGIVASSCLEGQVKIWDTNNGELIASIDRHKYFQLNRKFSNPLQMSSAQSVENFMVQSMYTTNFNNFKNNNVRAMLTGSGIQQPAAKMFEKTWSPIWCLDYLDNLIVIGCADGRLEFWEATTGNLKVIIIATKKK